MSSIRRRLMSQVASDPNALPVGCVRLEYIESTGTQYIDTEKVVYANEDIYIDFQYISNPHNKFIFGWRWQKTYSDPYQCYINVNSDMNLFYGVNTNFGVELALTNRNKLKISPNNKEITVNGTVASGVYDTTFTNAYNGDEGSVYPAILFTFNLVGTVNTGVNSVIRLFEYSLTDSEGNYTQHLIPILDPNGTSCMYDMVAKKYHYNKGTGTFLYKIAE